MTEPKPSYDANMGQNCPGCGIEITIGNAGGYRTFCDKCVNLIERLTAAQTAVVAMLKECGLRQVIISADGTHNRYSNAGSNVYYVFDDLAELYAEKKPAPVMVQAGMFE